jgi:hypothetical protein
MAVRFAEWGRILVALSVVSACSGGDVESEKRDPSSIVVPENVSEAQFAALVKDIGCNAIGPCCADSGYEYDGDICAVRFADSFGFYPRPHFSFRSAQATQCLKELQNGFGCAALPASCREVYRGTQPLGSACGLDAECESTAEQTLTCDELSDGLCKIRTQGALGDSCDQTCPADHERYATCVDTFSHGNPALPADTHVACDRSRGLYCDASAAQCKPLAEVGSSCSETTQCAVGSWCTETKDGDALQPSSCQPLATVGLPCVSPLECAGNAYCGSDGACHAPQSKADHEPCSLSNECAGRCERGRCTGAAAAHGLPRAATEAVCGGHAS